MYMPFITAVEKQKIHGVESSVFSETLFLVYICIFKVLNHMKEQISEFMNILVWN